MSEVLPQFPKRKRGRPAIYNWDYLLDGRTHKLVRGEDFDTEPKSFRALAHHTANSPKYGNGVETTVKNNTVIIRYKEDQ